MKEKLNIQQLVEQVRLSLQGTAKNALHKTWGPEGPPWGTSFADLEEFAVQIGDLVSREVLQQALAAQAQQPPPDSLLVCPACCGPLDDKIPQPRSIQATRGGADWLEPALSCPRCRRAFFPSEQEPGH